jgi:hypothetical protein
VVLQVDVVDVVSVVVVDVVDVDVEVVVVVSFAPCEVIISILSKFSLNFLFWITLMEFNFLSC